MAYLLPLIPMTYFLGKYHASKYREKYGNFLHYFRHITGLVSGCYNHVAILNLDDETDPEYISKSGTPVHVHGFLCDSCGNVSHCTVIQNAEPDKVGWIDYSTNFKKL